MIQTKHIFIEKIFNSYADAVTKSGNVPIFDGKWSEVFYFDSDEALFRILG